MKLNFYSGLLALCLASAALTSCKKDDEDVSGKSALTSREWVVTENKVVVTQGTQNTTTDLLRNDLDCNKDDFLKFTNDNRILNNEGATKCNSADKQEDEIGTYVLTENDKKMTINITGQAGIPFTVVELNGQRMELESKITQGNTTQTQTLKYRKR